MRGIILKDTIRMFGLKEGFTFWFNWSIRYSIQQFWWLNIIHKSYCLECGWYCESWKKQLKRECDGKKLTKRKDILNHWKEIEKEIKTIEKGKGDMCIYCGEEKGTETISNPNWDKMTSWLVCKDCKETINYQQQYSMAQIMGNEKMASEALNKLDEIARRTKKPIMVAEIKKTKSGYKTASIEFTGNE